ncbi:hypothetical protein FRC07_012169 [Ceratobasidium sp. 392]|nr:hypothetical protein FRC07_012169 [Ceratobasidium sp. 392]
MHARSHSASTSSSSSSIYEARPIQPKNIAVVGRGREALALSPNTAEEFRHNLSLAVCSSPELTIPVNYPPPNPNPGPVLRRIASEAPYKPSGGMRMSKLPPLPTASRSKGLPPPPRPRPRRRPPPVFVTKLGAPLALAEQTFSPFVAPESPRRSASVPPSAVSSSFWGCGGDVESEEDLDLDVLDAVYDEYEFSDNEESEYQQAKKSALGGTYFPPTIEGGRYFPSPPSSPRKARSTSPVLGPRRPLRVQVSVERVAFRDETPRHSDELMHFGRNMNMMGVAQGLPGLEDGIKTRQVVEQEAVHALGGQRATKLSIGKALGKWLKRHT